MRPNIFLRVLFGLILIAALVAVGAFIYNAGVAQGIAQGGRLAEPGGEGLPQPYFYPPFYRPWGFGLSGLCFSLLFVFLIFLAVRGLFFPGWRRHGPWKWYGSKDRWQGGIPPMVEEWHRKMHAAEEEPTPSQE